MSMDDRPYMLTASTLIGNDVKNSRGEHVGTVKELVIDPMSGRVVGAVLSANGAIRTANELATVPWDALTVSESDGVLYLDPTQEPVLSLEHDLTGSPMRWKSQILVYTSSVYRGHEGAK
jgi:sporulation protein YlmC with PRC-barrel domain